MLKVLRTALAGVEPEAEETNEVICYSEYAY